MVVNYWINYYENGLVMLTFNTEERWVDYHAYNNYMYQIGDEDITVPELEDLRVCLQTSHQEKDQISFIFIPFEMIGRDKVIKFVEGLA